MYFRVNVGTFDDFEKYIVFCVGVGTFFGAIKYEGYIIILLFKLYKMHHV
jgi:hypothetical protein